jgi:hypothetical protein
MQHPVRGRTNLPRRQETLEIWPVSKLAEYLKEDVAAGDAGRMQSWYTNPEDRDFFDPADCGYIKDTDWVEVAKESIRFWETEGRHLPVWQADPVNEAIDNFSSTSLTDQNRSALKSLFTDNIVVNERAKSMDEGRHRVAALELAGAEKVVVSVRR